MKDICKDWFSADGQGDALTQPGLFSIITRRVKQNGEGIYGVEGSCSKDSSDQVIEDVIKGWSQKRAGTVGGELPFAISKEAVNTHSQGPCAQAPLPGNAYNALPWWLADNKDVLVSEASLGWWKAGMWPGWVT
ncbi:hypothetical protein CapIbe_008046 [Capra ibex]